MNVDAYAVLAKNYDLLMEDVPYGRWINFIAAIADKMPKSQVRIVDAGCGTGTVALGLRQRGFSVIGLDGSSEMLALARSKADEMKLTLPLLHCDLTDLNLSADIVISSCDGINHLLAPKEVIKFFRRTHTCLSSCGYLIFDINSPYKYQQILANNVFAWKKNGLDIVWINQYAAPINQAEITLYSHVEKRSWNKASFAIVQRCHQLSTLIYYLQHTGFRLEGLWDNYSCRGITPKAQRITLVAQKL